MPGPVVVLELNELSPGLLQRFIDDGDLPAFARLRRESTTYLTDAGVDGEDLNPWVQWPTVHSGLRPEDHGVRTLGDGRLLDAPTLADAVCADGGTVWLCGPMNVVPAGPVRGAFLPDPWSIDVPPQPASLQPFHRFVAANVQEHTAERPAVGRDELLAFLRFLAGNGLTPSTAAAVVAQLVGERARRVPRWKRAVLLDRLQWDVFVRFHRALQPRLATFFSNSTAHFQHLFWRDMEPERFGIDPVAGQADAVRSGYRQVDRIVGDALRRFGHDSTIVFATALSQRANVDGDMTGRECFHRPRRLDALAASLGLTGAVDAAPVMAEEFHLFFDTAEHASAAADHLAAATVAGRRAFRARADGRQVFGGCDVFEPLPGRVELVVGGRSYPFDDLLYRAEAPRSGTHDPIGALWVRVPGRPGSVVDQPVPLEAVAPTILGLAGVPAPSSMAAEVFGLSA